VYSSAVDGNQSLSHTPGKIVQNLPSFGEFRVPGTSAYSDSIIALNLCISKWNHEWFEHKINLPYGFSDFQLGEKTSSPYLQVSVKL